MSESQTKAGNQECFEKLGKLEKRSLSLLSILSQLSLSHSLTLSTCSTTFVFMSMLKSRCLLPKLQWFSWHQQQQPVSLPIIEVNSWKSAHIISTVLVHFVMANDCACGSWTDDFESVKQVVLVIKCQSKWSNTYCAQCAIRYVCKVNNVQNYFRRRFYEN